MAISLPGNYRKVHAKHTGNKLPTIFKPLDNAISR
jgi:hypothetical protein